MHGQRLAGFRSAVDNIDDAFGNSGIAIKIEKELADSRCLFGRFEDHCIPGNQRRDDMAIGQMCGEIIGSKNREYTMRLMAHRIARAGLAIKAALRCPVGIGLYRDIDLVDHRFDFGARFPQRFAGFARNEIGKFLKIGFGSAGKSANPFQPAAQRCRCPTAPKRHVQRKQPHRRRHCCRAKAVLPSPVRKRQVRSRSKRWCDPMLPLTIFDRRNL